ncbi:MAG: ankyrin repeat domain-containing protein [Rickettsiales bacterium]|jgi:hypothetical protein|nr:ankyrin repeat domain-containing protein [Rickettsiales bacterium]
MEYKQWQKVLGTINTSNDLNGSNVIEKVKEELQREDSGIYQEWKDRQFDMNYIFKVQGDWPILNSTLLHIAAFAGYKKVAEALLAADVNVSAQDGHECTPLHWAACNNNLDVIV